MPKNNEIVNELISISPLVAGIAPHDPLYEVPAGYYEGLPDSITDRLATPDSTLLQTKNKWPVFSVPPVYFDNFATLLMQRIKAGEAASPAEELSLLSPLLGSMDKKSVLSVPAGYFNDLSDNVIAGMGALQVVNDELENLSPLMRDLQNKNVYAVPDGYFDQLTATAVSNVKEHAQQAKVVVMGKRKRWMGYAAAAVVMAAVITAGSIFLKQPAATNDALTSSLAKLSDQEILNYIDNHNTVFADSLNTIASADISINDAGDLLSDVSDDELQQYSDNNVVSKDDAMN